MARGHLVERVEVHRRVLADRRVRAAAGLHADDAVGRQRLAAHEELHVLAREDVVGDDGPAGTRSRIVLHSASTSAVLPEPTGPPIPIRRGVFLIRFTIETASNANTAAS